MKKTKSALLLFFLVFLTAKNFSQTTYLMSTGTQTISCGPVHNFYDTGGSGGNYGNSESFTLTFVPATAGQCIKVTFSLFDTRNNDILTIYNGSSTSSPLVGSYVNTSVPPTFTANGAVTFVWNTNATGVKPGWAATLECVNCPAATVQTVTCGTPLNFYDTGGSGGNYSNSENYTVTLVPSTLGQCMAINFTAFNTNSSNDYLTIYDGGSSSSPLVGIYSGTTIPTTFTTSGGAVTFVFVSDASGVSSGWAATASCVNCSVTSTTYLMSNTNVTLTCPSTGLFYDSGGAGGNYANSQNFTKTFTAPAGSCLQVSFSSAFNVESCCDRLKIFDGTSGASPSLGTFSGTTGPGIVQSTGTSITFSFTSDGSVVYAGWEATITCVSACSGTPSGGNVTAGTSPCPSSGSVGLIVNSASSGCGLTYQWQSGPTSAGPWTNVSGGTTSTISVATSSTTYYRRLTTCGANTGTSTASTAALNSVTCSPTYAASSITYSFTTFTGNLTPTTDDVLYSNIAMFGFPICYGGVTYWGGYIASNSAFVFDAVPCYPNLLSTTYAAAGVGTGWSLSMPAPNTSEAPRNAVLAPWHDTYPPAGGTIQYTTTGTSPNRVFIASWQNIPMFSCSTSSPGIYHTSQVKIYETSNIIEIHVGNKGVCPGWNDGNAILGLHNFDGTIYTPPVNATAHNAALSPAIYTWTMSNTAYRFTPNACASGSSGGCMVLPIHLKAFYGERKDRVNHLYWETSVEKNVKQYRIERSTDAINFEPIGTVSATNKPGKYQFDDLNAKEGLVNYYRVAIEDNDGSVERTYVYPLGGITGEDKLTLMAVYPNPSKTDFTVNIESKLKGNILLRVYNSFGLVVKQESVQLTEGFNNLNLKAEDLPKGVYVLSIESEFNEVVSKVKLIRN